MTSAGLYRCTKKGQGIGMEQSKRKTVTVKHKVLNKKEKKKRKKRIQQRLVLKKLTELFCQPILSSSNARNALV